MIYAYDFCRVFFIFQQDATFVSSCLRPQATQLSEAGFLLKKVRQI